MSVGFAGAPPPPTHLLLRLALLDIRLEFARDRRDLGEEAKLEVVEILGLAGKRSDYHVNHSIEHRFHWILNFSRVVLVAVGLHVPNDLMAKELGDFGSFKDEAFHVACGGGQMASLSPVSTLPHLIYPIVMPVRLEARRRT
jgi:hypothetical protein